MLKKANPDANTEKPFFTTSIGFTMDVIVRNESVLGLKIPLARPLYLACFSSFLVRRGLMSMEPPSCISESLLAVAMAAYLQHINL